MKKYFLILTLSGLIMSGCNETKLTYPETVKQDVVEDYFGVPIADPYRWLEDDNAADVKAWVEAKMPLPTAIWRKYRFGRL